MSVKGYLALLVGVFVVALAVVGASQRATAGACLETSLFDPA